MLLGQNSSARVGFEIRIPDSNKRLNGNAIRHGQRSRRRATIFSPSCVLFWHPENRGYGQGTSRGGEAVKQDRRQTANCLSLTPALEEMESSAAAARRAGRWRGCRG